MKINLTLSLCLLSFYSVFAQSPKLSWVKGIGGGLDDLGMAITVDASGNVYTTGYFQGVVDFDHGSGVFNLTSNGDNDIFIVKNDASGKFLWAKAIGGASDDRAYALKIDALGNIFTAGYFQDTVDFNPGGIPFKMVSNGSDDVYIMKLDASGNLLWAKSIGGNSLDGGKSIDLDGQGNIYCAGYFNDSLDFNPDAGIFNLKTTGSFSIFIIKLNNAGNFVWAKVISGTRDCAITSIDTDKSGNTVITGFFQETVDFDPNSGESKLTSNGESDVYILKLDAIGNIVWAKNIGGLAQDKATGINLDAFGNIYTTGYFAFTVDFDPGVGKTEIVSAGAWDVFVSKLDPSGNFIWAKGFGGYNQDIGQSQDIDSAGNVYITGNFIGISDMNPDPAVDFIFQSFGNYDMIIIKLNSSGKFVWATQIGGGNFEVGKDINVDASGNIYTTGNFISNCDFDPGTAFYEIFSEGKADIFIHKMGPAGAGVQNNNKHIFSGIKLFPNPAYDNLNIDLNEIKHQLSGEDVLEIQLVNSQGQIVLNEIYSSTAISINLKDISKGLYLAKIILISGGGKQLIATQKIIKQ